MEEDSEEVEGGEGGGRKECGGEGRRVESALRWR